MSMFFVRCGIGKKKILKNFSIAPGIGVGSEIIISKL